MDELSNLDKSRIAEFISQERDRWPDWFLSETGQNFASPADVALYFTAFCVALAHVNKALTEMGKILRKVKSIITSWRGITGQKVDGDGKSKSLRLKLEEKVVVVVYRSVCKGEGGLRTKDIAHMLGVSESEVEKALSTLLKNQILRLGAKSQLWSLVLA